MMNKEKAIGYMKGLGMLDDVVVAEKFGGLYRVY